MLFLLKILRIIRFIALILSFLVFLFLFIPSVALSSPKNLDELQKAEKAILIKLTQRYFIENSLEGYSRADMVYFLDDLNYTLPKKKKITVKPEKKKRKRLTKKEWREIQIKNLREIDKKNHLNEKAYREGREYLQDHKEIFAFLYSRGLLQGVPREVLTAILRIETLFGWNNGKFKALERLYFSDIKTRLRKYKNPKRKERSLDGKRLRIVSFFVICKKIDLRPKAVLGSLDGALGLTQFMPDSYMRFTVDGDGDGVINLFESHADAIASTANFLVKHGWHKDRIDAVRQYQGSGIRALVYKETIFKYVEHIKETNKGEE